MRVIRITTSVDFGGIEKVLELHAKYHDASYELIFLTLSYGGATAKRIENLGYQVIVLNLEARIPSFKLIRRLLSIFKDYKPDVIHTCGSEANFHGIIAAKLSGVNRIIAEEIGIPNHSKLANLIFKFIYKLSYKIIAISNAVMEYLVSFEANENRVVVIYNPIEKFRLNEKPFHLADGTKKFKISFVGRLEPIKNIDLLLSLVKHYSNELAIELVIIGKGSLRNQLENSARELGIISSVHFKGYIDNPSEIVSKTDVFILPSFYEGFGLACIEAIQAGVPVIVSNSGGMKEFIDDGIDGFTFDPNSIESLLNKVDEFFKLNAQERNKLVFNAQGKVNQMFSPDKYLNQLKNLYQG